MGLIISFFKWISGLLDVVLRWVSDLPGKITLFVTSFFTVISGIFSFFTSHFSDVTTFINSATAYLNTLSGYISSSGYGSVLIYCFSIDVAAQYVVTVGAVFFSGISLVVLALVGYSITFWVIPMAITLVQKMISVFTAGFIKV